MRIAAVARQHLLMPDPDELALVAQRACGNDVAARVRFVAELDALRTVERRSYVAGGLRLENSAEHSWHVATMALALAPLLGPVDIGRVVEMLLVHDIVEIDAGDTFVYDAEAREQKEELEQRAADRLFAMVPGDDGTRLRARWDEFEAGTTPEARFAHSLDRLAPLLLNHANRGELWAEYGITADRVVALNSYIADGSPSLWTAARTLLEDAIAQGWLGPAADQA